MARRSSTLIIVMAVLATLAAPRQGVGQSGAASCYNSLVSGPPPTLSASVQSINSNGTVVVNGGDTAQPNTPFQWAWGDGSTMSGGFPQQHTYASTSQNYVITITATENTGAIQQFSLPVFFSTPTFAEQTLPGISFQIPSQTVQFQTHYPGTTTPTGPTTYDTYFSDSSFPMYSRSDLAYVLAVASSIDYNFANSNSFLLDGVFSIDMLENSNYSGGYSFWYSTPMSVGYGPTIVNPPMWYILLNEIGKDTTLNTPVSFPYGGNTGGGITPAYASEIYSETMGDIFSYASGCQLISNAASYGIGPDVTSDIQNSMLAGAANLQAQFNTYVANGAPYTSWNPETGADPTLGTVATLAWKFIQHAEQNGQGYQIPTTRLMTLLQQFNASMLASYSPASDSPAAETFRSTLMVAGLSYAFSQDLRGEFESLNFPINNGIFDRLFEGVTGGGASLSPSTGAFAAQPTGSTSAGQTFTLTNYLLSPITLNASFSGSNPRDFPVQASSTCAYPSGTLAANSSCTYVIAFAPSVNGAESATFSVADTDGIQALASSPQTISLTGTGAAQVAWLSASSLTFGNQVVGTASAPQPVILNNTGSAALTVSISASADFGETDNCSGSVAGGGSCTINVTFQPTTSGWLSGALTITESGNGMAPGTQTVTLGGTGTAAAHNNPTRTYYAAGASAMFNSFGLAAALNNAAGQGVAALCGQHHWTMSGGGRIVDPRSVSIPPEHGDVWIAWDDNAAAGSGGTVCYYVSLNSVVGTRLYLARATTSLLAGSVGTADASPDIVPLLGQGEALPQAIFDTINGSLLNVAMTDLRPEDAKFATIRALTAANTRIPRTSYTGVGYGPFPLGAPVQSAWAGKSTQPVDFVLWQGGDLDPWTGLPGRNFSVYRVGADPIMVIYNKSNTGAGHLGDGNYTNINRGVLADIFTGQDTHIRQIAAVSTEPDEPIHVWQREPLAGSFNTMEFCIPLTEERWPTLLSLAPNGQETGVNPANTANCLVGPCTSENGNPFYHIAANGATRGRVVGVSQMVAAVDATPDSLGYAFWGFGTFATTSNTQYMTVDGIDPLYATPNGGVLPKCTALPCLLPFTHIANGSYPIWSVLRMVYDDEDPTCLANGMNIYAQAVAAKTLSDFIPFPSMNVFRSHFGQLVNDTTYAGQVPHNGITPYWPVETGGDMGGAPLTVQSELDYAADNGGQAEQVNERQ